MLGSQSFYFIVLYTFQASDYFLRSIMKCYSVPFFLVHIVDFL